MDIGLISVVVLVGMIGLLAIGMPLGFASGFLAVVVMVMKFGPTLLFSQFGTGPLNILAQRMYGLMHRLCADFGAAVHLDGDAAGAIEHRARNV